MTLSLDDLLAPMSPAQFFAEYHDRQPLHVKGGAAKFASVLSWRQINRLLDMTHIWSSHSLQLVLDGNKVPPEQYCGRATSRDNEQLWQPEAAKVRDWVGRGASLVLNDVDSLTPGLAAISAALEGAGLGKAQANVYVSWQSHKAFPAHFDTHDVWAVQVEGEKTWNIWEGRADWPIPHPAFRAMGQAQHEQAKGRLREKVTLRAGDLLYLPRGWYHDALAEAPASVHIAYGVHAVHGIDLMNILLDRAVRDVEFRKPLPRQDGSAAARFALTARAGQLGQRLAEFCREPQVMAVLEQFVAGYRYQRGGNDLLAARGLAAPAAAAEDAAAAVFRVLAGGAKPVRRGADWVLKTAAGVVPLSPPEAEAAGWILGRPDVAEGELRAAHPAVDAAALLTRLREAGLLVAA
ncbi:cupin domain-containing protein [Siccirubricoccus sp. KC 17139]|uniref:Cupin domain-containing protein n=1 Tax=Siccirubricoccus soli TaxID=2899147 RepID=A0ABT1D0D1_9PROT|nr:cupin domain-containing protein [Siccirubricoccus soli]MCO6415370.1 cupin domain-containing protein [Siccirubricoccus soli]MCP2681502.1 cupin domain-containing protein [Siccirubricoccus soli]